jgi:hypothetical protein
MARERRTISERVGSALADGGLTWGSGGHAVVVATGMAGITQPHVDTLLRLKYANDAKSYADALKAVVNLAALLNRRGAHRVRWAKLKSASALVLNYWLDDSCHTCNGLGFERVPGAPSLSDRVCQSCHGTGRCQVPWLLRLPQVPVGARNKTRVQRILKLRAERARLMLLHDQLLAVLQKSEALACADVARRLRTR